MFSKFFSNIHGGREAGIGRTAVIIFVVVIFGIIALLVTLGDGDIGEEPQDSPDENDVGNDLIMIDNPSPGDTIESPLLVSGEARGQWYFEANFSVDIVDDAGNVLVTAPIQADGEWMTEDFVPFSEEIEFNVDEAETAGGSVIFNRANPSGLPENADSVEVPITFSEFNGDDGDEATTVSVYWSSEEAAVAGDCSVVIEAEREVPQTQAVARAALTELLEGPTSAEIEAGQVTNIPEDAELLSVMIEDGVAYADFSQELNQVGGSCRVSAIWNQINETLLQFSTVDEVVISVEGETEEILQP